MLEPKIGVLLREDADSTQSPSPFRYLCSSDSSLLPNLKAIMPSFTSETRALTPKDVPLIPSSGVTRRLLSALLEGPTLDVAVATMSVAEGDNRYDAHVFARCVDKILGLQTQEENWREPISWKVGLYGRELAIDGEGGDRGPAELYG